LFFFFDVLLVFAVSSSFPSSEIDDAVEVAMDFFPRDEDRVKALETRAAATGGVTVRQKPPTRTTNSLREEVKETEDELKKSCFSIRFISNSPRRLAI
jgi:hypothetical protein